MPPQSGTGSSIDESIYHIVPNLGIKVFVPKMAKIQRRNLSRKISLLHELRPWQEFEYFLFELYVNISLNEATHLNLLPLRSRMVWLDPIDREWPLFEHLEIVSPAGLKNQIAEAIKQILRFVQIR